MNENEDSDEGFRSLTVHFGVHKLSRRMANHECLDQIQVPWIVKGVDFVTHPVHHASGLATLAPHHFWTPQKIVLHQYT